MADEESATLEQRKKAKKQKTSKIRISQAKEASNAASNHLESEGSFQLAPNSENDKLARRLAKRNRRALEKLQRAGLEHDKIRTREDKKDLRPVKIQGTKSLKKRNSAAAPNRHESREREKEGGQRLNGKHKSKQEDRRDETVQPKGKKSKANDLDTATWKVSEPVGGQMLDVDPVFSPDEK